MAIPRVDTRDNVKPWQFQDGVDIKDNVKPWHFQDGVETD